MMIGDIINDELSDIIGTDFGASILVLDGRSVACSKLIQLREDDVDGEGVLPFNTTETYVRRIDFPAQMPQVGTRCTVDGAEFSILAVEHIMSIALRLSLRRV